jgi:putative transposase
MSDVERKLALERYRLLEPHLQGGRQLRSVSKGSNVSFRTLQRWVAAYKCEGLAGLVRKGRTDSGGRRIVSPRLREAIEGLALEKPPLPLSSVHRQGCNDASPQVRYYPVHSWGRKHSLEGGFGPG